MGIYSIFEHFKQGEPEKLEQEAVDNPRVKKC